MSAMSVLWVIVYSLGCAAAIAAFEGVPVHPPSAHSDRRVRQRRVARSARGAAFMTLGLAMLLNGSREIAAPLWAAFVILSYVATTTRYSGARALRERVEIAAYLTLAAGVVALVEGILRDGRTGLFLCGASAVLLAAARVDLV